MGEEKTTETAGIFEEKRRALVPLRRRAPSHRALGRKQLPGTGMENGRHASGKLGTG